MMGIEEAVNTIVYLFAKMDRNNRKIMMGILKQARKKLDFDYPNGMPDIPPKPTDSLILPK